RGGSGTWTWFMAALYRLAYNSRQMSALRPISIIIPVLDAAPVLAGTLASLQELRARGNEVIVVDGGSRDNSLGVARRGADRVVMSGASRALQWNTGADYARHEILLFLNVDSRLPPGADVLVSEALQPQAARWGRFDLRLDSPCLVYRLVERLINWRSHFSGIATGEQALFVEREYFERVGCFDRIAHMEDVAFSRKLLHFARPPRITTPVLASAGRWERDGVLRTALLLGRLRLAFALGADPDRLAVLHRGGDGEV